MSAKEPEDPLKDVFFSALSIRRPISSSSSSAYSASGGTCDGSVREAAACRRFLVQAVKKGFVAGTEAHIFYDAFELVS